METNAIFRKITAASGRFFSMLGKEDLPICGIIGYLAPPRAAPSLPTWGVSTTEYSGRLFGRKRGAELWCCLTFSYQILSRSWVPVSGLINNLCEARMDRNLAPDGLAQTGEACPLRYMKT